MYLIRGCIWLSGDNHYFKWLIINQYMWTEVKDKVVDVGKHALLEQGIIQASHLDLFQHIGDQIHPVKS